MSDELDRLREKRRKRLIEEASRPEPPDEPIPIGDRGEFDEVLDRYSVVLVDFHADWCGPCELLEPTIEALARESDAAVATVDIDHHRTIAAEYRVRSVPTLLLVADGRPVERLVGVQDRGTLSALIDRYRSQGDATSGDA